MPRDPQRPDGHDGDRDAAREALDQALDDLEEMLESHEGDAPPAAAPPPTEGSDRQYTIPVLDDLVAPAPDEPSGPEEPAPSDLSPQEAATYRRLAARLASEIEVMVDARLQAATERAVAEIHRAVRNHIEIVLPEILDEILRQEDRTGD